MQDVGEQFDNPAHLSVTCPPGKYTNKCTNINNPLHPEFTQSRVLPLRDAYTKMCTTFTQQQQGGNYQQLCAQLIDTCHRGAEALLHSYATAHTAPQAVANGWG
jgi:hypothetical protein